VLLDLDPLPIEAIAGTQRGKRPSKPTAAATSSAPVAEPIRSDPDIVLGGASPTTVRPNHGVTPEAPRSTGKAARRAAVRRARMSALPHAPWSTLGPPDLLVLDEGAAARDPMIELLERFGFVVHRVHDIQQAQAAIAARPFAAALLNLALDARPNGAAATLCRQVKRAPSPIPGRTAALILMADRARSTDRVRAEMAGSDAVLLKPVDRGQLVHVLENCAIALPNDPRRSD
jgi:CheY-like chemotaxis protein